MTFQTAVPALPVRDPAAAAEFYRDRMGFTVHHQDEGFAIVTRDEVEIHLWQAGDTTWSGRDDLAVSPVCTGDESFLAGTASCRILVGSIDEVYRDLAAAGVLHPADAGAPVDTAWGTREFPVSDLDGNLITVATSQAV